MCKKVEKFVKKWKSITTFAKSNLVITPLLIMSKFINEYSGKIDDRGRLIFPSAWKSNMGDERLCFIIKKDLYADCLNMYTYKEWEEESERIKSRLNFFNKSHALFWREYMRDRAIVEPDAKLGRFTIPKRLLESIYAEKEVVFFGLDHKIEIWAKERFESQKMDAQDVAELAENILG